METKKGCVSISEIAEQLSSEMRECLPFAHAFSGCDTVLATHGFGKLRAYKKLHESDSWRDIIRIVGDEDVDREYMIEMGKNSTFNCTASLVKRQIRWIIFVILCI